MIWATGRKKEMKQYDLLGLNMQCYRKRGLAPQRTSEGDHPLEKEQGPLSSVEVHHKEVNAIGSSMSSNSSNGNWKTSKVSLGSFSVF